MYDLIGDMLAAPEPKPELPITPNFVPRQVLLINMTIAKINAMTEYDLTLILRTYIDSITSDVLSNDCPYSAAFTHPKFVVTITRLMNTIPVDETKRLCCNKIIYDYMTLLEGKDANLVALYLALGRVVNRDAVAKLVSIGLDEQQACNLAVCRYSTTDVKVGAKRLNFVICNQDVESMTEQMIVWIYEKLFDKFNDLFQATMFEVYRPEEESGLGEDFMEIYARVTLAVLTILNNMPTDDISRVIKAYYDEWSYRGRYKIRCSMRTLSSDWYRITNVVEYLNSTSAYNIP